MTARVDVEHLQKVRRSTRSLAPSGKLHLVFEVLAYASDEAESNGGGSATVTLGADGSVRVVDDGRGTDTRRNEDGVVVKKPVMATPDLRFFDDPSTQSLPDGHPRRGMSVVAALSDWLLHENRRLGGGWQQRYEQGIPVTDLVPLLPNGSTGTAVHLLPSQNVEGVYGEATLLMSTASTPWLRVDVVDDRQ